jgi:DNA-directed RNA polymerase specialized sigma24 family protein
MLTTPNRAPTILRMPAPPLQRIEQLTSRLNKLTTERELAIALALDADATWAEIAQSLGCSTQAAHRRYRWLRYNLKTGAVWHERPLPL